jgi:MtrB/PioB family decaheme-associated outer membrane protein
MPAAWATDNDIIPSNGIVGTDVSLKLQRKALGLSAEKWITPELQLQMKFGNEDKNGARLSGRVGMSSNILLTRPIYKNTGSFSGGWAVLLMPEPIDSAIRTMEGQFNFNRGDLALSGGYHGSFYVNHNGSMTANVPDTLNRGVLWTVCETPGCSTVQQLASADVALPPDNQAHQVYLSGNYAFSPTTRANFKLSYTHATQNDSFVGMGLTPAATAPDNLGGVVDTTLAYVGWSMRPSKQLTVNASLRFEDRADKTPVYVYNDGGISELSGTTNWPSGSQTRTTAKVDGTFRMLGGYTVSMGMDWERKVVPVPPANTAIANNQVFFRSDLQEYGAHATVRKAVSETLNGALGFEYKARRGDDNAWVTTSGTVGNLLVGVDPVLLNRVLPTMYMDRDRTTLRASLDWVPTEDLSLDMVLEHGQDDFLRWYPDPLPSQVLPTLAGAQVITNDSLTLDTAYKLSRNWQANAYWTRSKNRWNVNKVDLGENTVTQGNTLGLGLKGKLTPQLSFGADLLFSRDVTTFTNLVATANVGEPGMIAGWVGQTLPGNYLPDITYRTTELKLYGSYAMDKKSSVQVTLVHQRFNSDDWQWGYNGVPFVYSDNTTVSYNLNQSVTFVGAVYTYRF